MITHDDIRLLFEGCLVGGNTWLQLKFNKLKNIDEAMKSLREQNTILVEENKRLKGLLRANHILNKKELSRQENNRLA